jgi:hypothetical protein
MKDLPMGIFNSSQGEFNSLLDESEAQPSTI